MTTNVLGLNGQPGCAKVDQIAPKIPCHLTAKITHVRPGGGRWVAAGSRHFLRQPGPGNGASQIQPVAISPNTVAASRFSSTGR